MNSEDSTTTQKEHCFYLLILRWRSIFLLCWESNPGIPVAPQEEAVSPWMSKGMPVVVPPLQKTPMSQSKDTTDYPALSRLSPQVSTHNTMVCVTAVGHLERKPQIPMSTVQEAWHHCTPREKSRLACLHTRWGLTTLFKLHRSPETHVSTGEELWCSGLSSRGGPRTRHHLERNPERPLATRMETGLSWGNTSGSLKSTSYLNRNPKFPAATREKPGDSPLKVRWGLFCCSVLREIPPSHLSLQRVLDTLDATQEVPRHTHLHLRGTPRVKPQLKKSLCFHLHLKMSVHFPA